MPCPADSKFESRSIEVQLRVEVCSSIIVPSLQMLDDRRGLRLFQEVRKLCKHLVRKFTDLLVRPPTRFGQREDRRELLRGQTTCGLAIPFRNFGDNSSVGGMAVAIYIGVTVPAGDSLRNVEVQMHSDAEQRDALLQAVRGRGR